MMLITQAMRPPARPSRQVRQLEPRSEDHGGLGWSVVGANRGETPRKAALGAAKCCEVLALLPSCAAYDLMRHHHRGLLHVV